MKKIIVLIIAFAMMLTMPVIAFAENEPEPSQTQPAQDAAASAEPTPVPTPEPTPTPDPTSQDRQGAPGVDLSRIEAESAMLVDADTGEVLFSKNADWRIFPASTTKLMTAILAAENCKMEDVVTYTADMKTQVGLLGTNGSLMELYNLKPDVQISVKDLFYGMMLCSGNDAALVLGIHIAGSEEAFVQMMNAKAKELGMTNTNFINPHGAYFANIGQDHYSTAADMAKLAAAAYKIPVIREAAATETYAYETVSGLTTNETLGDDVIENSNLLMHTMASRPELAGYLYDKATGMKTGLIQNIMPPGAEQPIKNYGCLVASASSDNLNLIAVVFGDQTKEDKEQGIPGAHARWDITKYLFDYGFENFAKVDLAKFAAPVALTEQVENASGNDPQEGSLEVSADLSGIAADTQLLDAATAKGLEDGSIQLEQKTNINGPIKAPVSAGDEVGTVSYSLNGQELYSAPLVAGRQIFQKGEEEQTSEAYDVPLFEFQMWFLWIIIPAAVILALLAVRTFNISRRKKRYAGRGRPAYSKPPRAGSAKMGKDSVQRRHSSARSRSGGGRRSRL